MPCPPTIEPWANHRHGLVDFITGKPQDHQEYLQHRARGRHPLGSREISLTTTTEESTPLRLWDMEMGMRGPRPEERLLAAGSTSISKGRRPLPFGLRDRHSSCLLHYEVL